MRKGVCWLVFLLVLLLLPALALAEAQQKMNFTSDDDRLTLTEVVGAVDVEIPESVADRPVVAIGPRAFEGSPELISVVLPKTVVSIDPEAFAANLKLAKVEVDPANKRFRMDGDALVTIEGKLVWRPGGPAPEADPASVPAPEPTQQPTADGDETAAVLRALGDELLSATHAHLRAGNEIKKNDKGDELKGVQQLLNLLGDKLTVDGHVGGKSIKAMNDAQKALGLEPTQTLTQLGFETLLRAAYIAKDPEGARAFLGEKYGAEIDYIAAAAQNRRGNNFTAYKAFLELGDFKDSAERAQACKLKFPKNSQVYRNSQYKGGRSELRIKTSEDEGCATLVKVYTKADETHVASVFIKAKGSYTISLPAGDYIVKVGAGHTWFGPNEAFGIDFDESRYRRLTFEDTGTDVLTQKSRYRTTLTLGGATENNVGSQHEDPSAF